MMRLSRHPPQGLVLRLDKFFAIYPAPPTCTGIQAVCENELFSASEVGSQGIRAWRLFAVKQ